METDRRVQLRLYASDEHLPGFGSGYLVAPRLVLTAAHVVTDESDVVDRLTVCRPGGTEFDAHTVWRRKDDLVDAALVEVDSGNGWEPPRTLRDVRTRPPQRWGRLIGTRPLDVDVVGFPRMQKDPGTQARLDEHLLGRVVPGSGSLAGRLEIISRDPTIPVSVPRGSPATRWSGMSGAPVLAGELLCGVIRQDRRAEDGSRLTATPVETLLADQDFRTALEAHTGWVPQTEPAEPTRLLLPAAAQRDLRSPAALLSADAESVAFHGRDDELAQLSVWCHGQAAFGVLMMTGSGGQGKTRLARRLAELRAADGWVTGQLRAPLHGPLTAAELETLDTTEPLLLVIDYAETRPQLVRDLIDHFHATRHHVRLLLVARADGSWRRDTLDASTRAVQILASAPEMPLSPLLPSDELTSDREAAFLHAARDLAARAPYVPTLSDADWTSVANCLRPPADLHDRRYASVLALQMTALTTLLEHGPAPTDTTAAEPPEAVLLTHEQRYWEGMAKSPAFQLGLRATLLHRAVAVAAAFGAADVREAEATVRRIPGIPVDKARDVAEWLHALYPPEPDRYWASVQPDRVAEFHASRVLADPDFPLAELFQESSDTQKAQLANVLARAAVGHADGDRAAAYDQAAVAINETVDLHPMPPATRATAAAALQLLADRRAQDVVRALAQQVADVEGRAYAQMQGGLLGASIDLVFTMRAANETHAASASLSLRMSQLADFYRRTLKPQRLVLTGPPGAGKTFTAVHLILSLMTGSEEAPVPVRLSAASWTGGSLRSWLGQQLTEIWGLRRPDARLLVDARLVLPVIDGLDELPSHQGAELLQAANAYQDNRHSAALILTCRGSEYDAFVRTNIGLRDSALLQLMPVDSGQIRAYLQHRAVAHTRWQPVLDAIDSPDAMDLRQSLANPWLLSLAVTLYEQRFHDGGWIRDPSLLLEFATADGLSPHLMDGYVHAVLTAAQDWHPGSAHLDPRRTYRYLSVLACHLHTDAPVAGRVTDTTNLVPTSLWPLPGARRVRSTDRVLTAVIVTAPVVVLPTLLGASGTGFVSLLWVLPLIVLAAVAVRGRPWPEPADRSLSLPRTRADRRLAAAKLVESLAIGFTVGLTQRAPLGAGYGIVAGLMCVLTTRAHKPVTDPREPLRRDLFMWLGPGVVTGITVGCWYALTTNAASAVAAGFGAGLALALAAALGTGFAGRAWVRYMAFLLCARVRGLLPLRLGRFLDVCHQLGLLRVAGAGYQFRHRELQEVLAERLHAGAGRGEM